MSDVTDAPVPTPEPAIDMPQYPDYLTKPRSKVLMQQIGAFWDELSYWDVEIDNSRERLTTKDRTTVIGIRSNMINGLPVNFKHKNEKEMRKLAAFAHRRLRAWRMRQKEVWA